MVNADLDLGGP